MANFLWYEDAGSGYQFWTVLCRAIYPGIAVVSQKNNTRLSKVAAQMQQIMERSVLQDAWKEAGLS